MFSSIADDFKNAWNRPNNSLQRIIIINFVVWAALNLFLAFFPTLGVFLKDNLTMPTEATAFIRKPWTFITSFFTQIDLWHMLMNMLFLYWFGKLIKEYLGDDKLVSLFFLGGISGSIAILVLFNAIPGFQQYAGGIALGASAGVFAVSVGAATLIPNYSFSLIFIGPVKIKYIVAFQIFLAFIGLKGNNFGGELAHLAGAFIGYFYIRRLQQGQDIGLWIHNIKNFFTGLFTKKAKMKVNRNTSASSSKKAKSSKSNAVVNQEEIDAILDKIADKGYESLSKSEKEKLFNASKK